MQFILMIKKTRRILFIVLMMILFIGGILAWYVEFPSMHKIVEWVDILRSQEHGVGLFIGGLVYTILLSLPFIPGVELGLVLMCLFGKESILFVYFCTISGLSLSFVGGRWLPRQWILFWLTHLGVTAADIEGNNWMQHLLSRSATGNRLKNRLNTHLVKYRYVVLGALFNLPGNFMLGGGGGIALVCGIKNHSFSWQGFLMTIAIATAPVPLLVYLGFIQIENFITM